MGSIGVSRRSLSRIVVPHHFHRFTVRLFIQKVAQVALEAGNGPQLIFQNYRELVRRAKAKAWFAIVPKGKKSGEPKAESKKGQAERPGNVVELAAAAA